MGQFIAPKATTTQRLTIIPDQGELLFDTTVNKLYGGDGTTTGGFLIGNGDVSGPSSAVNNSVVFFDGTTGKLIKDSGLTLSGTNTGDQTITLTGDVTGSGTGSFAATLATQAGVTTGTYNSATQITPITIDSKGRITNTGTTVTIAPLFSSIASKPTTLSGYGITDALSTSSTTSALTSFGTNPNLNNPLLTSISTVGGGGLEGGQINFARVTDGIGYWFIDSYGSTASPDLRIVESATERFKFGAGGAFYVGGSAGTSGQVLTSAGTSASPTWTSVLTNPMTTDGDIIYGGVSGAATRLAGSATNGWVLTYDTTINAPKWAASSGGGGMAIGGSITSATAGSVLFADTSGVLAQDNTNFFWNNTNKRLGIGTASPTTTLDVRGAFNFLNTGALTSTLQDIGTYTINSSGTTAVGFGMRLLLQGRVNTSDSQPFGYISPYIRYYSALPSSWGTGMNIAIYNNGSYINVINITGNSGGEVTITNGLTVGGQSYISANSLSHSTQVIGGFNNGQNSAITYRTTNAGSLLTSQGVFGLATVTAGSISIRPHDTNGLVFTAGNGSSHIARAAIQIQNLNNTAGAESGDLVFFTQNGGTAISEKIRIFAGGNVGIGTGNSNSGYKFDVNGTARFQNDVTISDTRNFIFSATTGTKIGTATGQKLAFWNKTPIAQPTTASLSSTFTANTGTAVNDASTFGGYTLKQIAQALIDIGILA